MNMKRKHGGQEGINSKLMEVRFVAIVLYKVRVPAVIHEHRSEGAPKAQESGCDKPHGPRRWRRAAFLVRERHKHIRADVTIPRGGGGGDAPHF